MNNLTVDGDANDNPTIWLGPVAVMTRTRHNATGFDALAALVEDAQPAPEPCAYETRRATLVDPPEFCDEEAVPGSDYCKGHDPDAYEDYLVERAESRREMEMER